MDTNNVSLILSALFQVLIFSLIPFAWWFITARKTTGFLNWVGLKKPEVNNKTPFVLLVIFLTLLFIGMTFLPVIIVETSETAAAQFAGQGSRLLLGGLAWGIIATGLGEEVLFRGFLGKRLINKFGFNAGNTIQGLAFGLMHGILFMLLSDVGWVLSVIITLTTGALGWLLGFINEKYANGSIVPSWLIHGIGNFIVSVLSMYSVI